MTQGEQSHAATDAALPALAEGAAANPQIPSLEGYVRTMMQWVRNRLEK